MILREAPAYDPFEGMEVLKQQRGSLHTITVRGTQEELEARIAAASASLL